MKLQATWILGLCLIASSGCTAWIDPLPETPENLRLAVVTVALQENGGAAPVVTRDQAQATVTQASDVWNKNCGITFAFKDHVVINTDASNLPYRADGDQAIFALRDRLSLQHYVTVVFTPTLRPSNDSDPIGGNAMFPSAVEAQQAVMMGEAKFYIFAHEMGHFFSLQHVADDPWPETADNDPSNLMFPGDFAASYERKLIPVQCDAAKHTILAHEALRPFCRPDATDPTLSKDNCPEVKFL